MRSPTCTAAGNVTEWVVVAMVALLSGAITGDVSLAREQLHFGIEGFEQGAFPASDPADQVYELARGDREVYLRKNHLPASQEFLFRTAAERIVGVVNRRVTESDNIFVICLHADKSVVATSKISKKSSPRSTPGQKKHHRNFRTHSVREKGPNAVVNGRFCLQNRAFLFCNSDGGYLFLSKYLRES